MFVSHIYFASLDGLSRQEYFVIAIHYSDVITSAMVSHRCLQCYLNSLFRRRSKKTSKLRFTGLCEDNPRVTGGFPKEPVMRKMFPFDGDGAIMMTGVFGGNRGYLLGCNATLKLIDVSGTGSFLFAWPCKLYRMLKISLACTCKIDNICLKLIMYALMPHGQFSISIRLLHYR